MRKSLIAAGVLSLVLTVGACGDEEPTAGSTGGEPGSSESGKSGSSEGTDPGASGGSGSISNAGGLADLVTKQTSQAKTSKVSMTMDMGQMSMKMDGEGEYSGADSKMKMTMDMMGQKIDMVLVDKTMYMKMPAGGEAGKPWIKMTAEEMTKLGGGANFDKQMEMSDPANFLDMLQDNGKILNESKEQLDGQEATKYSAEVDIQKMLESTGQSAQGLDTSKIDKLPMDVWLNSDNLPLQIEMDMGPLMKQAAEQAGDKMPAGMENAKMVAKYTDWGEPVDVKAPPASQVSDKSLGDLTGGAGGAPVPSTPGGN